MANPNPEHLFEQAERLLVPLPGESEPREGTFAGRSLRRTTASSISYQLRPRIFFLARRLVAHSITVSCIEV
jgi:hypothetical protein